MTTIELKANKRQIIGKKVRFLRGEGITPVHLFGHNVDSLALQTEPSQLQRVLTQAGKTKLIDLTIDRSKKARKVIAREVQKHPITGELLHVDFYEVKKTEKIKVDVPIILVGEAPAMKEKGRTLTHSLNSLSIECLPDKIPPQIEVDLSPLGEVGQAIYVRDITLGPDITVITGSDIMVARVSEARVEKAEEVAVPAEAEAVAEAAPEEVAEEKPEERPTA